MKKKQWMFIFVLLLSMGMILAGCGGTGSHSDGGEKAVAGEESAGEEEQKKVQVYTTVFALTSFAQQIGGEYVEVHPVIPPGVEPHGYEPTMKEMIAMEEADLFIYNGGGFEMWVERLLESIDTSNMLAVESVAGLELLENEGHEEHEEHDGEHAHEEADHDEHDHVHGPYDPHVWLDPLLALEQARQVKDALSTVDPVHQAEYERNFEIVSGEIEALHQEYEAVLTHAKQRKFVVSHAAFAYLAERYGLKQIPIRGISPEHEPTANEMVAITNTITEEGIGTILVEEFVSKKSAEVLAHETGATVMTINTIGNITVEQAEAHLHYQDLMRENLEALIVALQIDRE